MLKNYLLTAARNLGKNPGVTFISIMGLTVGVASCLLIGLFVKHELSFDRHFDRSEDLYRIAWFGDNPQTRTPHPMAQALVQDISEVEQAVSLSPIWGEGLTRPEISFQYEDKRYNEARVLSADSTFFDVFSFRFEHGSPETALRQLGGVVLTESTSQKYFGDADPLGKVLRVNDAFDLYVTAVVEDVPEASHFHFDMLISYVTLKPFEDGEFYDWSDFGHFNYVKLRADSDSRGVESTINQWSAGYIDFTEDTATRVADGSIGFRLQPVTDIHLRSNIRWELESNGSLEYVLLFSAAALLILLIACVNFINLATAGSETREREVAVRKIFGARRIQLARQFLVQAILVSVLAVLLAVGLVEILLPTINSFLGSSLYLPVSGIGLYLVLFGLIVMVGVLAGGYPAFVLSAFRPLQSLKGGSGRSAGSALFRKSLIVFQFVIAFVLVAAMLVVKGQLEHVQNMSLGIDEEHVIVVSAQSEEVVDQYETLRQRWLNDPAVSSVASVSNIPGGVFNQNPIWWQEENESIDAIPWYVDYDYLETLGIQLIKGRSFNRDFPGDIESAFMLNEAAVRQLGMENALGQVITYNDDGDKRKGTVIGVLKDFHFKSLHQQIEPMIVQLAPDAMSYILVKLAGRPIDESLASLRGVWADVVSTGPLTYRFLDATVDAQYSNERKTGILFTVFGGIALLLAALGLLGLVFLLARRRTREIGIRKTLGATSFSIIVMLSTEFMKLVVLAVLVGAPLAVMITRGWLSSFVYRMSLSPGVFILSALIVAIVAILTVVYQAARAAASDPVAALRCE